jgi:hypothetical protein
MPTITQSQERTIADLDNGDRMVISSSFGARLAQWIDRNQSNARY